ncbi:MAG: TlpA disulfide reductase family protein [Bacteroidia bacterium]
MPVVLKNDSKITLDLNIESFIKTAVKGDVHNLELKKLYDIYLNHNILTTDFDNRTRDINPINISDSLRNALNGEVYAMQTNFTNEVQNFVNTTTSDAAIYFASLYVIPNAGCESLNNSVNQAKKHAAEGVFTKKLAAYSSNSCMLEIGGEAPDIQLASPTGETVSLYSLRGKVVLIDFWASWCGPCRRENPNVVKLYNEYKEKGFEIYSVSLDQDASRWQAAIAQDKLTWTHVSDLRGWKSSAAALYRVTGIPQTYLLDKNGIIIGKGLRGAELEQKLSEIFN